MTGYVNFPVKDPDYENSGEGGMFVKLVVVDKKNKCSMCCGDYIIDMLGECFIGDDKRPRPNPDYSKCKNVEDIYKCQRREDKWQEYHFPNINNKSPRFVEQILDKYCSRNYKAVIVMGSTGWSGWNTKKKVNWVCSYRDLTPKGEILYHLIEKLYPGCDLHLLTFLDT